MSMASKVLVLGGGTAGTAMNASGTEYLDPHGNIPPGTTEFNRGFLMPFAGTLNALYVEMSGSPNNGGGTHGYGKQAIANTFATIERRDVGITLRITPQISEGCATRLERSFRVSLTPPTPTWASFRSTVW